MDSDSTRPASGLLAFLRRRSTVYGLAFANLCVPAVFLIAGFVHTRTAAPAIESPPLFSSPNSLWVDLMSSSEAEVSTKHWHLSYMQLFLRTSSLKRSFSLMGRDVIYAMEYAFGAARQMLHRSSFCLFQNSISIQGRSHLTCGIKRSRANLASLAAAA